MSEITANFFKILADPKRLELLYLLREKEITQDFIQEKLEISQSTTSQHLKTLIDSNLIEVEKSGKKKQYKIKDRRLFKLLDAFRTFIVKLNNDLDVLGTLPI